MEKQNDLGMNTYRTEKKPDNLTGFLFIMATILLLFGFGFRNIILGAVGVMCIVLGALLYIKNKVIEK